MDRTLLGMCEDEPISHDQILDVLEGTTEVSLKILAQSLHIVVWKQAREGLQPIHGGLEVGDAVEPHPCVLIATCKCRSTRLFRQSDASTALDPQAGPLLLQAPTSLST
jgi:hypothetical protein